MGKLYKFLTQEGAWIPVDIGDKVYINNKKCIVTEDLVHNLPSLFKPSYKRLEEYERMLLLYNECVMIGYGDYDMTLAQFWDLVKHIEPKLFYRKVLDLISKDVNYNKERKDVVYIITPHSRKKDDIVINAITSESNIKSCYFYDRNDANYAIEIMGDKIKYAV